MTLIDYLLEKNIISENQRKFAICENDNLKGCHLNILSSEFSISTLRLYKAKAEFYGLQFANLYIDECDINLLSFEKKDEYVKYQAIPWKKEGDKILIATSQINDELEKWANLNYKSYKFAITSPLDIQKKLNKIFREPTTKKAVNGLWEKNPEFSAKNLLGLKDAISLIITIICAVTLSVIFPKIFVYVLFISTGIFYLSTLLTKTILFLIGFYYSKNGKKDFNLSEINDCDLPVYTILVPLYNEHKIIHQLVDSIKSLDYPKSKLDVKLIVEEDDDITINAIKKLNCERCFQMIEVPFSEPRTKPKACNYALNFARGEYITIYDAEDIPDIKQLKKVIQTFKKSPDTKCVQCKLNFYNNDQNLLSKFFTIEYSILFEYLLLGLEKLNIPIPLGGTSNHFRTETLKKLYAWDPYNVTEDADLGIRIYQHNWKCKIINSTTMEECPVDLRSWIRQRSRWIKGHMQTYFVHMRNPYKLYKKTGILGFMGIQFFLGAPCLIFIISPILLFVSILLFVRIVSLPYGMPLWFTEPLQATIYMLIIGNILHIIQSLIVTFDKKLNISIIACFLFPFYWFLHSIASFKAVWQLIKNPHFWEKTDHGKSLLTHPK